ncbi:MAG: HNH endonuclease [Candidatus Marinimicrobia bacterium]|nr:HNH endonuclease [Candidatus Neomarinimicrobiota bacterium]
MSKYTEQYKDVRWQKLRLEVFKRDDFKCCRCGLEEEVSLNAHHLIYFPNAKPWEYDPEILISLCDDCHETVHEIEPFRRFYGKMLKEVCTAFRVLMEFKCRISELSNKEFGGNKNGD